MNRELSGNKIDLKPLKQSDIHPLWQLIYGTKNPEWKNWDAPYYPLINKTIEEYRISTETDGTYDSIAKFGIWTKGLKLIGTVGYYWKNRESNWLEIGITIYLPEYWSAGYGKESLELWISYLFEHKSMTRVGLTTWSGNHRMMRCAESLGMKKEAQIRGCRLWQGIYYDSIKYGLLKEEWKA